MINIKLLGGIKKIFTAEKLTINKDNITVQELLDYLIKNKPKNTPTLDINNLLIAINGVDSSALQGNSTLLQPNDIVSLIPVIHGGSLNRLQIKIFNFSISIMAIQGSSNYGECFLDELRKKFPNLIIQGVSKKFILSPSHAEKIITISLSAKKTKTLISKKLETDIIMRFAGTNQISKAFQVAGIKKKKNFFLIAIGTKQNLDTLFKTIQPVLTAVFFPLDNHTFLTKKFKITKNDMDSLISRYSLEDLLSERAAILL